MREYLKSLEQAIITQSKSGKFSEKFARIFTSTKPNEIEIELPFEYGKSHDNPVIEKFIKENPCAQYIVVGTCKFDPLNSIAPSIDTDLYYDDPNGNELHPSQEVLEIHKKDAELLKAILQKEMPWMKAAV